jgi:predicted pyridoxine 5'-phosphate oxidase superfamily flavin-nucleotide-binding protein
MPDDGFSGTWVFCPDESQWVGARPTEWVQEIQVRGNSVQVDEHTVDTAGRRAGTSLSARFDGRSYPVNGSSTIDAIAYHRSEERRIEGAATKDGRIVFREVVTLSPDGTRLTLSLSIARPGDMPVESVAVFERHEPGNGAPQVWERAASGVLTADMKRVVEEQRLGFVATVCPDGTPNVSPKGTTAVWDDNHLAFANIRSAGTLTNLRHNPAVEINVVDPFVRKGYRFKGSAEILESGAAHARAIEFYRSRGSRVSAIREVVLVHVQSAQPLDSPAYDFGATEAEVRERWERHFDSLRSRTWKARR